MPERFYAFASRNAKMLAVVIITTAIVLAIRFEAIDLTIDTESVKVSLKAR